MDRLWRQIGYLCRYAMQPYDTVLGMTSEERASLVSAVSDIVEEENVSSKGSG